MWPENVVYGHAAAFGFARLEPRARSLIFRRRWLDRAAGGVDSARPRRPHYPYSRARSRERTAQCRLRYDTEAEYQRLRPAACERGLRRGHASALAAGRTIEWQSLPTSFRTYSSDARTVADSSLRPSRRRSIGFPSSGSMPTRLLQPSNYWAYFGVTLPQRSFASSTSRSGTPTSLSRSASLMVSMPSITSCSNRGLSKGVPADIQGIQRIEYTSAKGMNRGDLVPSVVQYLVREHTHPRNRSEERR